MITNILEHPHLRGAPAWLESPVNTIFLLLSQSPPPRERERERERERKRESKRER